MVRGGSGAQTLWRGLAKALAVFAGAAMVAPALGEFIPSHADASCDPGRNSDSTYRWAGSKRTNSTVTAVAAEILVLDAHAEDGSVTAWTLLWDNTTSNPQYLAQTGTWVGAPGMPADRRGMHSFYEWTDTSGEVQKRFPAAQEVDTYPTFKTEYVESGFGDQFKFSIGDINDPDEYWVDASFDPNASQIMGETHSKADQLPGEPDDKESFDDMRYRLNSTWYDYYGTDVLTDPKIHDRDEVSAANHLHIWDLCE